MKPAPRQKKTVRPSETAHGLIAIKLSFNHYSGGRTSLLQLRQHQFLSVKLQFAWIVIIIPLYEIRK